MRAAIAALALAGCWPIEHTTARTIGRSMAAITMDPPGGLALHTERYGGTVVVSATWPRRCHRAVTDLVEVETTREARIIGTGDGESWGWWFLPALILVWPVGLADAAIANVIVLGGSPTVSQHTAAAGNLTWPCPTPARAIAIHVTLPSGAELDGMTDDRGDLVLVLPAGEEHGEIHAREVR